MSLTSGLLALVPFLLGGSEDDAASQSNLVPPMGAPDANAIGKVEVSKKGTEQQFKVRGENLDTTSPPGPFEAWLEDGVASGNFQSIGSMSLVSAPKGRWELSLKAKGSAPAILGVADVADTAGRIVQVRNAGGSTVYLHGIVGAIGTGGCAPTTPAVQRQFALQRPNPAPDPDAKGKVEVEKKGTEQEFEIEAERLDSAPNANFGAFLETAVDSGTYVLLGGLALVDSAKGKWKLELEAKCAAPPILGVADVSQLSGRRIEVRDANDTLLLFGVVPDLGAFQGSPNVNQQAKLTPPDATPPSPKAAGTARVRYLGKKGESTLDVKVRKLTGANSFSVWIETSPGSQVLEAVGSLDLKGKAETSGRFVVSTKKGDGLPFGVLTVKDLSGRRIEIRDSSDAVHLKGILP